ncbi:general secretion pathway protein I [Marinobacterium halophilum]|uniref:General secretion pathway protein I n=1 Tax=Marinobacterium halophilum TaxID=267374 RepID=A0A2P8F323_9GAMM|nr:prepilin-type N-terminal cleavage/methylation domain-containing protein [Marinobacterium halophilum]PSL16117.1 general secretion pathway protein I [Marinobacterium halophilum]
MTNTTRAMAGFTLLEVLVAFVLLSSVLGVVMQLNAQALDGTVRAGDRQRALMLAQSELDRILAHRELVPGQTQGVFDTDGMRWEANVSPFYFPQQDNAETQTRIVPYRIDLHVFLDESRSLQLTTLRLGVAP